MFIRKLLIACRTSRSEAEEAWMCWERARSKVPITAGSGQMAVLVLSREVSTMSHLERAFAGAIFIPSMTCQTILKSWRNNNHLACCQDSLCGSFM